MCVGVFVSCGGVGNGGGDGGGYGGGGANGMMDLWLHGTRRRTNFA